MKTITIKEPPSGLYGDSDVKRAFDNLLNDIENFIPDDRSYGNLSLKGNGNMAIAKSKAIENAAKTLTEIIKAVTTGRR